MKSTHVQWSLSRFAFSWLAVSALLLGTAQLEAQNGTTKANYKLAQKYSNDFVNQFVHSTSVTPRWLGETDVFWYSFQTSDGNHYWRVDPEAVTKAPLFNHERMAGLLSEEVRKPIDSTHLDLSRLEVNDAGTKMRFVVEDTRFEYHLVDRKLENKGEVPENERGQGGRGGRGRGGRGRGGRGRGGRGGGQDQEDDEPSPGAHRNFSPDYTAYVFAQGHDLFYVEASDAVKRQLAPIVEEMKAEEEAEEEAEKEWETNDWETQDAERGEESEDDDEEVEIDAREKWAEDANEAQAAQLSDDGEEDYSFRGGRGGRGRGGNQGNDDEDEEDPERKTRPNVNWAPDSSAFYVTRGDSRGIEDLFLVNSLSEPRPTLERYNYAMPGEKNVRHSELYIFDRESGELTQFEPKWTDEGYLNVHWRDEGAELRLVRRDRLLRNLEILSIDPSTGETTTLVDDGFEIGTIGSQNLRYLDDRDEMIWWSERSGWGHYYLYDLNGRMKNVITPGTFRASQIVEVDEEKGILYFRGNGREEGENIYYNHLYRVFLDGTGMAVMDPGDADHRSVLSPSQRYLVDNHNRVDQAPRSVLRNAEGRELMDLEETDLSSLYETGWKLPETFTVKAADGVTTLYGNMWKPFDFDENKKYPIIAHVYPGPQQEGVTHSFSATGGGRQQLANLGIIVIQVGHRGGTPGRSKAYQNFSYFNLRDYGLPDKKAAIEKLAARHSFIDVERVGIYGHSGGGFMTGAALLLPPYNDFFTVGVSSAGNHDNNVYNNTWSERYHGLRMLEEEEEDETEEDITNGGNGNGSQNGQQGQRGGRRGRRGQVNGSRNQEQDEDDEEDEEKSEFEIHIPANHELAENLKGHLLLVHGDMDNNVHPAGTIRLVDALIKANKRFDLLIIPGARHGFGAASGYFTQRMWEYFSEHLLGDYQSSADILDKSGDR